MVEKFWMSSTKACKLSKFLQEGTRAGAHVVDIVARREGDRGPQRCDCAIALAKVRIFVSELEMREGGAWKSRAGETRPRDQLLPRRGARGVIAEIFVLNFRDALTEQGIRWIPFVESTEQ
jgi:hypothetical protein